MSTQPATHLVSLADSQLLAKYAATKAESAFQPIFQRYAGLAYQVGYRITGQRELAEEVGQQVMIAVARKASALAEHESLAAWVHRSAVLSAKGL